MPTRKYLAAHEQRAMLPAGLVGFRSSFARFCSRWFSRSERTWLSIRKSTAGIIIAGSILTARALAPVEDRHCELEGLRRGRQSGERLDRLLEAPARKRNRSDCRAPTEALVVEHLYVAAPGSGETTALRRVVSVARRRGHRHHWPERSRQIHAREGAGRRLAAGAWESQT